VKKYIASSIGNNVEKRRQSIPKKIFGHKDNAAHVMYCNRNKVKGRKITEGNIHTRSWLP
jgi:hypothetical protein